MKLVVYFDAENKLDRQFGFWLIQEIQDLIRFSLNAKKLIQWDEFFNSDTKYKSLYGQKIKAKDIIIAGTKCLLCDVLEDQIIIRFNNNQFVPGMNRIKIYSVCKLINFGNMSIKGYPIFTSVFNRIAENINSYVDLYNMITEV